MTLNTATAPDAVAKTTPGTDHFIMTVRCADGIGVIATVTKALADCNANVTESATYSDPSTGQFFMRSEFEIPADPHAKRVVDAALEFCRVRRDMRIEVFPSTRRSRVLLMVSKADHCLQDLLYRHRIGELDMDIPAVVSNHDDLRPLVEWHGIPFVHLPLAKDTKAKQEKALLDLIEREAVDLVVLARYMQILSPEVCARLPGRVINIHHSFLPGFKGAKPYHQAHSRGVKIVGATAHYVTSDLDEGPIIDQEVERVDHTYTPERLVAIGREIESRVLARAVRDHIHRRVFLNDGRTVVLK
ncbi:Formyltetrahydrofolate deformylase [uncultured Alphaproteobacteria bacterium]|uniref:Formyltetrahydrofolate deformylase n=1 Tax=uncultured Alphaproteobacteria bacterium TaxID=91750 RepID=A0A212KMG7_9PROT|nr:Formyltetrahydrofolate deformylase [uncultured Alphaproteobacteria bacterium]